MCRKKYYKNKLFQLGLEDTPNIFLSDKHACREFNS